ncbi:MAG TPA: hypothetical protein VK066_20060 [Chloroflexota bacterium]|nr:hypothetical protein [Chloroflexota bacterium]
MEGVWVAAVLYAAGTVGTAFVLELRGALDAHDRALVAVFWPLAVLIGGGLVLAGVGRDMAHWCLGDGAEEVGRR